MRALVLILMASAAQAGSYALPQGCTGVATIQARDCEVSHLFRCGDARTHRVDLNDSGILFYNIVDAETRWLESHHLVVGEVDRLDSEVDPASLSELLNTGADSYDFTTRSDKGEVQRYVGQDKLTGQSLTVNGVTLLETEFQMEVYTADGNWDWSSAGREYVHPGWRSFVAGVRKISTPEDSYEVDSSPMQIALPGQPGFLADRPLYGCDVLLSQVMP